MLVFNQGLLVSEPPPLIKPPRPQLPLNLLDLTYGRFVLVVLIILLLTLLAAAFPIQAVQVIAVHALTPVLSLVALPWDGLHSDEDVFDKL